MKGTLAEHAFTTARSTLKGPRESERHKDRLTYPRPPHLGPRQALPASQGLAPQSLAQPGIPPDGTPSSSRTRAGTGRTGIQATPWSRGKGGVVAAA